MKEKIYGYAFLQMKFYINIVILYKNRSIHNKYRIFDLYKFFTFPLASFCLRFRFYSAASEF